MANTISKIEPRRVVRTSQSTAKPAPSEASMFDMEEWPHAATVVTEMTMNSTRVEQSSHPQNSEQLVNEVTLHLIRHSE